MLFAGVVHAETVAFSFSSANPSTGLAGGPSTYGFRFTPLVNITIDSLGYLDVGQDGLATSEQVGIWNSGGTLLTSTVVTTGNSTLEGAVFDGAQFRFTAITPLALLSGQTYTLGASYNETSGDAVYYDFGATQGSNVPALLTVGPDGFFNVNSGFVDPTSDIGDHYDIGNFTVATAAATPEPSSMALLVLGLAGIAGTRFRRR
jgi:Domain of unknown function (DUF4082)/PEP-CTERM motif